jgi:signal transduction histidine kinase
MTTNVLKPHEMLYKIVLERRWWLVLLIIFSITLFEFVEHQEEIPPLNSIFLIELFFLGLFLPSLFGMVLQSLAQSENRRTLINQQQWLVEKITQQILNIDEWEELNELLVRFPQSISPIVATALLYNFGRDPQQFETISEWRHKDHPITAYPNKVEFLNHSPLLNQDLHEITAGHFPGLIIPKGYIGYCLPIILNGKFASLLHVYLKKEQEITPDADKVFRSLMPVITFAIGNLTQRQLGVRVPISAAERSQLARTLHDTVGQNLGFLLMKLDEVQKKVSTRQANIHLELEEMGKVANEAYEQVRDTLSALKPSPAQELATSLYQTAVFVTKNQPHLNISMTSEGLAITLPPDIVQQILSIFREAMVNVVKHAHATQLNIHIMWLEDTLQIVLQDNGQGIHSIDENINSHGLRIILEEAAEIRAILTFHSQENHGTTVTLKLPVAGY